MSAFFELARESDSKIHIFRAINNICEPHFHSNIELVYVVSGKINITINGQIKALTEGCVSVANSYDIHSYTNIENSDTIVMIIPVEIVNTYVATIRSKVFSSSFIDSCENTKSIFVMMEKLLLSDETVNELINKGAAYYILGLLCDCVDLIDKPVVSSTDLARKILVYLQQNYLNSLSIETLAKHFGYNKDYLSKFFNSYLGCGFNSYMNALRSRHAAQLISSGKSDLTDIAFMSGFGNYRTFNRAFLQSYGITPSEYKKRLAGITLVSHLEGSC
ncbi:MAG: DNA-binding protein AraC-type [Eubacterium sp.]|jgi:AraC-like DNA-binding protein|nr:DNA-binding protein AraC-type [Eubacterium sp.]